MSLDISINISTGEETIWDDVQLCFKVFSNGSGQINGIGKSIFKNNVIPFIIVGEFDSYLKQITFRKVHLGKRVKNIVSYVGKLEYYMNHFTISISGEVATGSISINLERDRMENNYSEFKGNIFKLTSKKSVFNLLLLFWFFFSS
jgi:hypothetical protein